MDRRETLFPFGIEEETGKKLVRGVSVVFLAMVLSGTVFYICKGNETGLMMQIISSRRILYILTVTLLVISLIAILIGLLLK